MDYLPERRSTLKSEAFEKQTKIKDFWSYLADKEVVLGIVKLFLSIWEMETWPEDPLKYVHDYFGNYRDPMWDQVDDWKKEN